MVICFMQQSLEEMANSKKKIRSESGVVGKTTLRPAGELYERWKKKSRKEVGGIVVEDEDRMNYQRPSPNVKVNRHVKDEVRGLQDIKKLQKTRENAKLKNMPKEKRRAIESINRRKKKTAQASHGPKYSTSSGHRKSKLIMRH